jgi:predicted nucleic acid-binding Zn ribbon protein
MGRCYPRGARRQVSNTSCLRAVISSVEKICPPPALVGYTHDMATYVYETIPKKPGQKPRQFEVEQKMSDPALTHDPKTGLPVRRLIIGGSLITRGTSILSMNRPKRR